MTRNKMWKSAALAVTFGSAISTVVVGAEGPDVIVSALLTPFNYGSEDPSGTGDYISAFSAGLTFCNFGTDPFGASILTNQLPIASESMYRHKQGALEQIGMSWAYEGAFYVLNQSGCGFTCEAPPFPSGDFLFPGCSDPTTASLVGARTYLGPTWEIDAHTGYFPWPLTPASGSGPIANRLQVHNVDLDPTLNPGATYFVQAHSIHPQDAVAGNGNNNASHARIPIVQSGSNSNIYNAGTLGPTQAMQSAIRAWKDNDASVMETDAQVPGEGLFILSAKVTDLGTGFWHYEYALQNLNSDRSGGSFSVPLPQGVIVDNIGFHDVDYHDGDGAGGQNWDGTDWPSTVEEDQITWATTPYEFNPNANALRWSTLYNFRFDADIRPDDSTITLGLFKPGIPSEIGISTIGPRLSAIGDFDRDGDFDLFDAGGLQACFSGTIENPLLAAPSAECLLRFDFNNDGDVDLADYERFFAAYTGP